MDRSFSLSLAQIIARLAQLVGQKCSGTFFVATDANTSCRFALEEGKITHCVHKRDQGLAALESFLTMNGGSCSFSESQFASFRESALVKHDDCLKLLNIVISTPESAKSVQSKPVATPTLNLGVDNRFYRGGFCA